LYCSDSILADLSGSFNVVIHADKTIRMKCIQYEYGIPEKDIEETLQKMDRERETYYKSMPNVNGDV